MDFGIILENWEKKNPKTSYSEKDQELENQSNSNFKRTSLSSSIIKKMKPQAVLDLHGFTATEAEAKIIAFLEENKRLRHTKVQIIHGKGLHSKDGESVLSAVVYNTLRDCPIAGKTGTPKERDGGYGATWVILK